jgi:CRP-like cAMP-binding protein
MEKRHLLNFLEKQPMLTPADVTALLAQWQTPRRLRRGDYLSAPGRVEQHLWFVEEGVLRLYYPADEDEVCVGFAYGGTVVTSAPSFVRQQPSAFTIQALSACTLVGIGRSAFYRLQESSVGVARLWATLLEHAAVGIIEREIEISTTTPEQRYENLVQRAPHLLQLVPLKYIASYLRIKPETLSRVRRGRSEK